MKTILDTESMSETELDAYYSYEQGTHDRKSGKPPRFSDSYYFRGYSDQIVREVAIDLAHSR